MMKPWILGSPPRCPCGLSIEACFAQGKPIVGIQLSWLLGGGQKKRRGFSTLAAPLWGNVHRKNDQINHWMAWG